MKSNHIPKSERLKRRIQRLECKLEYEEPIGGGNPYCRCMHCGKSVPYISIDGGHYKGCPVTGWESEIKHYKKVLNGEV